MKEERHLLGVFLDFENLALGFRGQDDRFDVERVLARLVEKGNIVVKRAYADWKRFPGYARSLQEAAFELLQRPPRGITGKNSADMRLCVDVLDLCYSKSHIDSFVVVSGDSDFLPLVSKLKENGRTVIGLGMKESTSSLLRDNCDEFIYYEDLEAEVAAAAVALPGADDKEREAYALLLDSLNALRRENRENYWASLIKETMVRKKPSFNEAYYGFKSFSALLEGAAARDLVALERDPNRRTLRVSAFGDEMKRARREAREVGGRRTAEGGRREAGERLAPAAAPRRRRVSGGSSGAAERRE
ncbi:MAG: NYN domain-containing protein [Planctomycetes bacterium]|nr:NYN domain-containing protein [Planctomycetota bacterium]